METSELVAKADAEIADIIAYINDNMPASIKTVSSCSGWAGTEEGATRSDGVNRKWVGHPYISFLSLDDAKILGGLVPYLIKNLVFDIQGKIIFQEDLDHFHAFVAEKGLASDVPDLIHVSLTHRQKKIQVNIYIEDRDKDWAYVEKIWALLLSLLKSFS